MENAIQMRERITNIIFHLSRAAHIAAATWYRSAGIYVVCIYIWTSHDDGGASMLRIVCDCIYIIYILSEAWLGLKWVREK